MAIVYDRLSGVAGGRPRRVAGISRRRLASSGPGGDACCDDCAEAAGGVLAGLGELAAMGGGRGQTLRRLARAHLAGALPRRRSGGSANLGDIDMGSFIVSQATIDAEAAAFDGRLNAWLLDYAGAAARLPPAWVQQVDDFVARWRDQKDTFYFFQTNRLHDLVNTEAEFNRLRDQFLAYGHTTSIAPATVTADGKTVRSDQIPAGTDWFSQVRTVAMWGGVIVGGAALLKISSDLGLFRRLGRVIGPAAP